MYFSSWQAALQMQGHGIYVWPAYLIGVGALIIFAWVLRARTRRVLRKLKRQVESSASGVQRASNS
jgi:hypothetical protein